MFDKRIQDLSQARSGNKTGIEHARAPYVRGNSPATSACPVRAAPCSTIRRTRECLVETAQIARRGYRSYLGRPSGAAGLTFRHTSPALEESADMLRRYGHSAAGTASGMLSSPDVAERPGFRCARFPGRFPNPLRNPTAPPSASPAGERRRGNRRCCP